MLATIGYWKFAKLLNVDLKWLLFLPFYRQAYIGLMANAYAQEQKLQSEDMSVAEIFAVLLVCVVTVLRYLCGGTILNLILWIVLLISFIIRIITNYIIFKLANKHALIAALLSWIPGVVLWQAVSAEKEIMKQ